MLVIVCSKDTITSQITINSFPHLQQLNVKRCLSENKLWKMIIAESPALFILERDFSPNLLELCRKIKNSISNTAIIILTKSFDRQFYISAFQIGVDDIVLCPFIPMLFFLKCFNLIKRLKGTTIIREPTRLGGYTPERFFKRNRVTFDLETGEIFSAKEIITVLGPKELTLFSILLREIGRFVSADEIKRIVFRSLETNDSTVSTIIKRLRRKLSKTKVAKIETKRKLGYGLILI